MTTGRVVVAETPVEGPVPRHEVPGWRERYGVVAGITGRGASTEFDLGLWTGRPVGDVMRRWTAFRQVEPGFPGMVLGHQVHGTVVGHRDRIPGWLMVDGVDGHATDVTGLMLAVTVADCIPVYLVDPVQRAIALLHSGWRGTASGILETAVEFMKSRYKSSAANIIIHCGIGICGECYEVGSEVMEALGSAPSGGPPWNVDLRQVLEVQARRIGIESVSTSRFCSSHDGGFHSHRGSGRSAGRMVAYLGMPGGN